MCGFVGAFFFNPQKLNEDIESQLQKACKKLQHRGPDATATFTNKSLGIAFGQSRLKIQDLSDHANQPFFSKDKRFILLFNGQIYNHWNLRKELPNYHFLTTSDTETLLAAIIQWELTPALKKLEGMFAFAFFDSLKNELILVRDRFGIKSLYFHQTTNAIFFSSELTALKTLLNTEPILSELSIYHFSRVLAVPAPLTPFINFFKIPAGFLLQITKNNFNVSQWYDLKNFFENQPFSNQASKEEVEFLFKNSVKKHLCSDVPIGIFLSGGIDSSLITKIASQHKKILAFHLHFENQKNFDELAVAKKVAKICNIPLNILSINQERFFEMQEKVLEHIDDLIGDPVCISFALLSEFAKQKEIKVVLAGEGADELFWGYDNYFKHLNLEGLPSKILSKTPFAKQIIKIFFSGYKAESLIRASQSKFSFLSGALGFKIFANSFNPTSKIFQQQLEWIHKFLNPNLSYFNPLDHSTWRKLENLNVIQKITYLEFCHRLPELLLMRCDKMGMMFGVETRVPFLDHHLVEKIITMPFELKTKSTNKKLFLKNFFRKEFCFQLNKKIGFSAPFLQKNKSWSTDLVSKFSKN